MEHQKDENDLRIQRIWLQSELFRPSTGPRCDWRWFGGWSSGRAQSQTRSIDRCFQPRKHARQ